MTLVINDWESYTLFLCSRIQIQIMQQLLLSTVDGLLEKWPPVCKKKAVSNMPPHFAKFDLFLALMFYGTMVVVKIDS
jgi:hypothetical protein